MFKDKSLMIIGNGDMLETKFCFIFLQRYPELKRLIVYNSNKEKQAEMKRLLPDNTQVKYVLGGIHRLRKLNRIMRGVDYLLWVGEYSSEAEKSAGDFLRSYINGTENIIRAALTQKVSKVLVLSSEKVCNPVDIEGIAKLCAEKLVLSAGEKKPELENTKFSILRYGKAINGPEGVIDELRKQAENGCLYLEDVDATRFWFTLEHCVAWLIKALSVMEGGEIFVPQTPSVRMMELAQLICSQCQIKQVGIRVGSKLHELMVTEEEGLRTLEFPDHYLIQGQSKIESMNNDESSADGRQVAKGFIYSSISNNNNLSAEELSFLVLRSVKGKG